MENTLTSDLPPLLPTCSHHGWSSFCLSVLAKHNEAWKSQVRSLSLLQVLNATISVAAYFSGVRHVGTSPMLVVQDVSDEEIEVPHENLADPSGYPTDHREQATQATGSSTSSTNVRSSDSERVGYRDASISPREPVAVGSSVTAGSQTEGPYTRIGSVVPPRSANDRQPVSLPIRRLNSVHSPVSEEVDFISYPSEPPPPYPGLRQMSARLPNGPLNLSQSRIQTLPSAQYQLSAGEEEQIQTDSHQTMRDLVRAYQ